MRWSKMSHVGLVRTTNEDNLCARPELGLFAVADGMGGHRAGEVASKKAIEWLVKIVAANPDRKNDPGPLLREAILKANEEVYRLGSKNPNYRGMGTTLTTCFFGDNKLTVAHVGDSRCYLLRDSSIYRLTRDHSLVEELVRQNQLTSGEAVNYPYRNVLTRALGTSPVVEVDVSEHVLRSGDVVLLCTDGVTEHLADEEIVALTTGKNPKEAVELLVQEVLNRGGSDNVSLIMVAID